MNPVYVRMVLYFLAPLVGALPGVTFNIEAGTLLLDLEVVAVGIAGSALFTGAVFAKWGKK